MYKNKFSGMISLNNNENKGFFIFGTIVGFFSSIQNMILSEFFPLILVKAITIAACSGFATIFGKRVFEILVKRIYKRDKEVDVKIKYKKKI